MNPHSTRRGEVNPTLLLVACILAAALTALVTTLVMAPTGRGLPPPTPSRADGKGAIPPLPRPVREGGSDLPELRRQVRELAAKVVTLEKAGTPRRSLDAAVQRESLEEKIGRLLARVKGVKQGEQQVMLEMAVMELVKIGPPVIPAVAACLATGHDRVYREGFAFSGGRFRSYPRYRTVLFDLLTQIGTPAAYSALFDAVERKGQPLDYRDLLLVFGNSRNEQVIDRINGLVPQFLEIAGKQVQGELKEEGMGSFTLSLFRWIEKRRPVQVAGHIAAYLKKCNSGSRYNQWAFAALFSLSEEEAYRCLDQLRIPGRELTRWLPTHHLALWPRAKIASFLREVLDRFPGDRTLKRRLFIFLPTTPCGTIADPSARLADIQILLDFVTERERAEVDKSLKSHLGRLRERMEKSLASLRGR